MCVNIDLSVSNVQLAMTLDRKTNIMTIKQRSLTLWFVS